MREKLLVEWKQKYERIQWELGDNERKLENVIKRQKKLPGNVFYPVAMTFIGFLLVFCLWCFRDGIMFMFYPFYLAAVFGLAIATVAINGYRFIKEIRRYLWHVRKWDSVTYPKPETVRSNYPLHIPPNYYAEHVCIEWLLHQYTDAAMKLIALRRKIENTPEQDLEPLQKELDAIVIYERVGRTRD